MGNGIGGRLKNYFSRIDRKLLIVCILSLLVPITLNGVYFASGYVELIREHEFRQAQNNVDKIEDQLNEILGKAVDIANRIYVNSRIHQTVGTEYKSLLEIYNAYNAISMFDDYLHSYKEIAGIRLYVENPTMLNSSYFIVADEDVRSESWYKTAQALDGRMFWIYRRDPIFRSRFVSLVRQIRNTVTGSFVGILCVNLNMSTLERICAAELYDTLISLNGEVICPVGMDMGDFPPADNWIITNSFVPGQSLNSVFEITNIIPQKMLFAPVYSMIRKSLVIILVSFAVSLALILQIINEVYIQQLQKERLFSHQQEMQLKILSNQINPHFLYNTLETIRMMALEKKEKKIATTIKMLSQLLRQSLSANEKTVPLEKEIELVQNYLAIQKLRFGDRVDYSIDMKPNLGGCTILPLLIQPLVENSFIHGLETKPGGGHIRIAVETQGKTLCIDVSDNGIGMEPQRLEKLRSDLAVSEGSIDGHIGLVNVNRRIKLHYGDDFGLTVSESAGNGFTARLAVPLGGTTGGGV
jgi:two-component system sensor histidine kinase YesM